MTGFQKLMIRIVPRNWATQMEADSRAWKAVCECGHSRSIWDLGGIRWKAKGSPRSSIPCPTCGKSTWHRIEWRP